MAASAPAQAPAPSPAPQPTATASGSDPSAPPGTPSPPAEPTDPNAPAPVTPYRLFPLEDPDRWISILDAKGAEVGLVRDLRELDKESQTILRDELYRRYTVPELRRIISSKERFDLVEWEIETSRGQRTILLRDARNNIQPRPPNRFIVTDADGNRYDIPDFAALDPRSRTTLERYF